MFAIYPVKEVGRDDVLLYLISGAATLGLLFSKERGIPLLKIINPHTMTQSKIFRAVVDC